MSKKGENIYKRKDNRWEARYIKGYRPDGGPKYGYCYGKTYREAREKAAQAKAALLTGKPASALTTRRHFTYYCDEWLQLNRSRVKESTYVKYRGILEKHIKPRLGCLSVRCLTTVTVEQFSYDLLSEGALSPKSVKDILMVLHSILQYTVKQFSEPLPMPEIVYPKVPRNEMRVLTREEQTRLVSYLLQNMDEYKFGVLLALLTGMRIGEVCALRWGNVSLTEQSIKVTSSMQRLQNLDGSRECKTRILISDPKSRNSTRLIPLTAYAVRLCKIRHSSDPEAFVLTGESGRYIEPRLMQYRLERFTRECGIEGVHFHTLRHTFATRCVEVDFEIKSLSEILGHSSPQITLERYVHSSIELKRENMNKLATIGF